jgi:hypothetical protein
LLTPSIFPGSPGHRPATRRVFVFLVVRSPRISPESQGLARARDSRKRFASTRRGPYMPATMIAITAGTFDAVAATAQSALRPGPQSVERPLDLLCVVVQD